MGEVTIHTDASVDRSVNRAGIGWILKAESQPDASHSTTVSYHSSTAVEWLAIVHALSWIQLNRDADSVTVYTDSHSVAVVADGSSTPSARMTHKWYSRFQKVEEYFQSVTVRYIPSHQNREADRLARQSIREGRT